MAAIKMRGGPSPEPKGLVRLKAVLCLGSKYSRTNEDWKALTAGETLSGEEFAGLNVVLALRLRKRKVGITNHPKTRRGALGF